MAFSVLYKIEESNIRKLELISRTDGYLQILRMNPDWAALLEGRARLMEAVSSIGIEGTVLSIDQAKAITVGAKDVVVGEKERREFVGYYTSLEYVKDHVNEPLGIGLLLRIHEMVTRGDPNANPGRIRTDLRAIKSKGRIIYTAPAPDKLDVLLREFIEWFNHAADDKGLSPVIAAALCHFWFVWIHPFCDGNGRVSRLLTTFLLLKKRSEGIRYFALSDYYNLNKDSYYDALEQANKCVPTLPAMNFKEDLSPWISYFLNSYLAQMSKLQEVTSRILQLNIRIERLRKSSLLTESHNKILSFLASRERASYEELVEYCGVTKSRINQILKPLRSAHILVENRIGSRLWFMLGSPEEDADEEALKRPVKRKLKRRVVDKKKPNNKGPSGQLVLPIFEQ